MDWFKFHNTILDEPRIIQLNPIQKLLFIRLMALANGSKEYGTVKHLNNHYLFVLERLDEDQIQYAENPLQIFEELELIEKVEDQTFKITYFLEHQEQISESTERVRRFRNKHKDMLRNVTETDSNVSKTNETFHETHKSRVDKIRIDNKEESNTPTKKTSSSKEITDYLENPPNEDIEEFRAIYLVNQSDLKKKLEAIHGWFTTRSPAIQAKYRNPKRIIQNVLLRDFGKRKAPLQNYDIQIIEEPNKADPNDPNLYKENRR